LGKLKEVAIVRARYFVLGLVVGWLSVVLLALAFMLIARAKLDAGAEARNHEASANPVESIVLHPPRLEPRELGAFDYAWQVEWGEAGKPGDFASYRNRVLVLTTWASWCLPCLAEFPKLAELAAQLPEDEVAVVSLSVDPVDRFRQAMTKDGREPPGRVARQGDQIPALVWSRVVPTTWVVSRTGDIVIRHEGAADWSAPAVVDFLRELATGSQTAPSTERTESETK
jgi:thiol-disulfide isomerase/thioredoxin